MSGGAQQGSSVLQNPWPGSLSFGFPPSPVERDHWLVKAAAVHVGGDIQAWGAHEWELAARYLSHALEISMRDYLHKSLVQPLTIKRGRGRPPNHRLLFSNALLGDAFGAGGGKPRRPRGRPQIADEVWLGVYDLIGYYRSELTRLKANTRLTDKAVITYAAQQAARRAGHSQSWVRKVIPKMQKRYSEAKKRVGKIRGNP